MQSIELLPPREALRRPPRPSAGTTVISNNAAGAIALGIANGANAVATQVVLVQSPIDIAVLLGGRPR